MPGEWGDKDTRRRCAGCGKVGLRYGSTTGLCGVCYRHLPMLIKVSGAAAVRNYVSAANDDVEQPATATKPTPPADRRRP